MKNIYSKVLLKECLHNISIKKQNSYNVTLNVGDLVQLFYKIYENGKGRTQTYEGIIIAIKNKNLEKSFILRYQIDGIKIEQIFFFNSPNILLIKKKRSLKFRQSKLYYYKCKNY